jgi:hypothetical protein
MRYGLNAAIIAGLSSLALGEPVRPPGERIGDYLPGSGEITPPAGFYFESDIHFHDRSSIGGAKLHPDGRRVARNFASRPWRWRPFEATRS